MISFAPGHHLLHHFRDPGGDRDSSVAADRLPSRHGGQLEVLRLLGSAFSRLHLGSSRRTSESDGAPAATIVSPAFAGVAALECRAEAGAGKLSASCGSATSLTTALELATTGGALGAFGTPAEGLLLVLRARHGRAGGSVAVLGGSAAVPTLALPHAPSAAADSRQPRTAVTLVRGLISIKASESVCQDVPLL